MKRFLSLLALLFLAAAPAAAQQELDVAKIYLNGSPTLTSGSGTPESVITATPGSLFLRTDTGTIYLKATGTGNTGWVVSLLTGTGTTNTLAKWTGATALGDSSLTDTAGAVNVGANLLPTLTDTYDFGSPTKLWNQGYLAQLNAILFALQTQTLLGGYSTIGYNAGSFAAAVSSGATTINFGTTMTPGHFVLTRAHDTGGTPTAEFFQVGTLVSGTTYNVTRNLSGLGAKNWAQGVPFLVLGTTGTSRIDLLAYDGKPRIQFVEQGATYNAQTVRALFGNLNGYYGYASDLNGIGMGNASGARFTLDPTNGIRIYGGDNDEKVTIDTSGNATFDGAITVGTGRNQIRNSECRISADDWNLFTNHGLTTVLTGPSFSPWRLNDALNTCYATVAPGTPAAGTVTNVFGSEYMPVVAGNKYELSVYLGLHRATSANASILWYNSSAVLIGSSNSNTCTTASAGGTTLSTYCRAVAIGTAPVGATTARVQAGMVHDGVNVDPFLFMVRWYFAEANPQQEDPTQWGPAGVTSINNGLIETDAINARTIAADSITTSELAADSVTSAKIVAGTIVASDIAAGTITGTQIAATTITASNLNVSSLSAITGNMGTLTAGTITGGTIDGATIKAGSGDEVTLDSAGISMQAGTGANNKIKWSDGVTVSAPNSGSTLYVDGGLTVERSVVVTGTGAGAAAITVNGGFGIAADTLISPSMASSTGTPVIWETACGCLKKQTSSLRYKEHVIPWSLPGASRLLNLTPIRFDYKGAGEKGVIGLSVEQLFMVAPEAVNLDAEGRPDSVRQDTLNVYLLELIKDLRAEVDALKRERKQ